MSEPVGKPRPKKAGLRQFVFSMMISALGSLSFFPSGHVAQGPVTELAMGIAGQWDGALTRIIHMLPRLHLGG